LKIILKRTRLRFLITIAVPIGVDILNKKEVIEMAIESPLYPHLTWLSMKIIRRQQTAKSLHPATIRGFFGHPRIASDCKVVGAGHTFFY
jgi:hypothetical protein